MSFALDSMVLSLAQKTVTVSPSVVSPLPLYSMGMKWSVAPESTIALNDGWYFCLER